MAPTYRFFIVDDHLLSAETTQGVLQRAGHEAEICQSGPQALKDVPKIKPDCVILDIMMPELDGMELCRLLRAMPELDDMKIIVFTAKSYESDQNRARELGADGYIIKPLKPASFLDEVTQIVEDKVTVKFWGVRGTLPRPGPESLKYGGQTSCVTLNFPRNQFFIMDAGTGIKQVGQDLLSQGKTRVEGKLFISHPHWDHINCIPFFVPLYIPGNDFEILGASHGDITMRELVSAQMEGVYFPITIREFGARVYFRDLREGTYDVGGIEVQTMLLSHPGYCLGYRINYKGRSICYITDNELFLPDSEFYSEQYETRLADFIRSADMFITDTTYTDQEYQSKVGWGHSCISRVVDIAIKGEVETLYLFHHDPDQTDDDIDTKLDMARTLLSERGSAIVCEAPKEGEVIRI